MRSARPSDLDSLNICGKSLGLSYDHNGVGFQASVEGGQTGETKLKRPIREPKLMLLNKPTSCINDVVKFGGGNRMLKKARRELDNVCRESRKRNNQESCVCKYSPFGQANKSIRKWSKY